MGRIARMFHTLRPPAAQWRRAIRWSASLLLGVALPCAPLDAQGGDAFAGIETRTLPNGLKVWLKRFVDEPSVDVTLIVGGQNKTANSVVDRTVDSGVQRTAHFALGAATSSYQIVIVGLSTTALDVFHVAERLDVAI